MKLLLTHPLLKNDFQLELAKANAKTKDANPAFSWLVAHEAKPWLLNAVNQCTAFKPTPGLDGKPSHWTSPPPCGSDQCIVIVIGMDVKGAVRACASNAVAKPAISEAPLPDNFFEQFDALRSAATQSKLLHLVVSGAVSKEHMSLVDRVFEEGDRFRTSPIFLVVLDGDKQHLYATTALVQAPQQTDSSRQWTGRVSK